MDPQNYSFAVFYKTFGKDEGRRTVHVDQSDWTGLVYLNKPEDCQGGTSFYQHIETGLDSVPNADRIQEMGFENREDFVKKFVSKEGKDLNRWKRIGRVGMKSNRMLLFRAGEMFHAADAYFGNSDTDCRLAQLFFFKIQGAAL